MVGFLLPSPAITSIEGYLDRGVGGRGLDAARRLGPTSTIEEVTAAGLRGRGGGGFPTGRKWAGIAEQPEHPRYLVCNAAEGEPGTFKDRAILRADPYQVVEGLAIAAFAVGATEAFICIKGSYEREVRAVTRAVQELQGAGICAECTVTIVAGPDEYLFGEEKAMLEVIEGKPPLPRWFPPYEHGLFAAAPQEDGRPAPAPVASATAPTPPWSTTSRRSRMSPTSCTVAPRGSGPWGPRHHPARWSPPSPVTPVVPAWRRSSSGRRCAR